MNIHYFGKDTTKEYIMNYVHDVLTANDEMFPENNERFKFNDRKEGRGSEITEKGDRVTSARERWRAGQSV